MKLFRFIFLLGFFWTICPIAKAKEGDTTIHIFYETNAVRVNPTPHTGGATVDFRIVLHADGTVNDVYSSSSGTKGSHKSKLGPSLKGLTYKVIDSSTIVRTGDAGNYLFIVTIKVAGKNCAATVERRLKPGEKYFREYSGSLKAMADFSIIENKYTACVIE